METAFAVRTWGRFKNIKSLPCVHSINFESTYGDLWQSTQVSLAVKLSK